MLTVNQIDDLTRAESPVVALAVGPDGTLVGPVAQIPERWAQRATEFVSNVEWKPKPGAVRFVDGIGDGLVLCLVGVGAPTSASDVGQIDRPGGDQPGGDQADAAGGPHDLELLRRAAATVVARCQQRTSVALAIASTEDEMVASIEGALLGSYRFVEFKGALTTQPAPQLASIEVLTPVSDRGAEESPRDRSSWTVDNAIAACQATIQARDWVNADGASLPPEVFADAARELLESAGLAVEVWDEHRLASERCGGILGVGQGSSRPPRLVIASYEAPNPVGSVTLVGKE
ncbi:MAG: hypothetical protein H6512_15005 [Acidimicrobiia bacterium]|nr:hypothetical protein [Acidimicrobiia bacterium]